MNDDFSYFVKGFYIAAGVLCAVWLGVELAGVLYGQGTSGRGSLRNRDDLLNGLMRNGQDFGGRGDVHDPPFSGEGHSPSREGT